MSLYKKYGPGQPTLLGYQTTPPLYYAEELFSSLEVQERDAPVPIMRIAEGLHVDISYTSGKGYDAALEASRICINESLSQVMQRFALAQALGHYVLHPLGSYYVGVNTEDTKGVEAYTFACELLMPGHLLRAYIQATTDISKLAKCFGVHEPVMAARLKSYFRL